MSNRHCSLHGFAETIFWMVMFRMKHRRNTRSKLNEKQSGFDDTSETREIEQCESQGESLITSASFLLIVALKGVLCVLWLKWSVKTVFLPMCHLNRKNGCKLSILWKMSNHSSHSVRSKRFFSSLNILSIRKSTIFSLLFLHYETKILSPSASSFMNARWLHILHKRMQLLTVLHRLVCRQIRNAVWNTPESEFLSDSCGTERKMISRRRSFELQKTCRTEKSSIQKRYMTFGIQSQSLHCFWIKGTIWTLLRTPERKSCTVRRSRSQK